MCDLQLDLGEIYCSDSQLYNRPYKYDVIISLRPHLEYIGLRVNAVVSDVPAAYHKRIQGNAFVPQQSGAMKSMHKVYNVSVMQLRVSHFIVEIIHV